MQLSSQFTYSVIFWAVTDDSFKSGMFKKYYVLGAHYDIILVEDGRMETY